MRSNPAGILLRALIIVGLGVGVGLVDAQIRPVRLHADNAKGVDDFLGPEEVPAPEGPAQTDPVTPQPSDGQPPAPVQPAPTDPTPQPAQADPQPEQPVKPPKVEPERPAHHITVAQAYRLYQRGDTQWVDARIEDYYVEGHVPGAYRWTLEDFETGVPAEVYFLDYSAPVIVYCQGGDCHESDAVRLQLKGEGFENVFVLFDGYPGWADAGHPVVTGPDRGEQ